MTFSSAGIDAKTLRRRPFPTQFFNFPTKVGLGARRPGCFRAKRTSDCAKPLASRMRSAECLLVVKLMRCYCAWGKCLKRTPASSEPNPQFKILSHAKFFVEAANFDQHLFRQGRIAKDALRNVPRGIRILRVVHMKRSDFWRWKHSRARLGGLSGVVKSAPKPQTESKFVVFCDVSSDEAGIAIHIIVEKDDESGVTGGAEVAPRAPSRDRDSPVRSRGPICTGRSTFNASAVLSVAPSTTTMTSKSFARGNILREE